MLGLDARAIPRIIHNGGVAVIQCPRIPRHDPIGPTHSASTRCALLFWYGLTSLTLVSGCMPPEERIALPGNGGSTAAFYRQSTIGRSVEGRPIECEIFGDGPDVVLIIATIHGDEPAGTPLVRELSDHLRNHPPLLDGRRIVIVPVANPDGMKKNLRHNVRGVDLNRNFPAGNYATASKHGESPLSEPESRALHRLMQEHPPARIVSIHQPTTLPACIDFDGPAEGLAHAMARHTDLPIHKIGSRPGSLGSYAGVTMQTPIITLEIPRTADDGDGAALWRRYGAMMLAAIEYPRPPSLMANETGM